MIPIGTTNIVVSLVVILGSILFLAFFNGSEAALISANKIRIRHGAEQGSRAAQSVLRILRDPEKFYATISVSINVWVIFASSFGTAVAIAILGQGELSALVASLVMTVVLIMFGEITPKTLALQVAERLSLLVARPMELIIQVLTPLVYLFTLPPRGLSRLFGWHYLGPSPVITEGELRMLVDIGEAEGIVERQAGAMIDRIFAFGERQVREVMIPRPQIVAVPETESLGEFLKVFAEAPRARFPVYKDSIDNVTGILSIKDVLRALAQDEVHRESALFRLQRPALFVPETKRVGETFTEMQSTGQQMAIVVDEYGGTAGLVTLEQLIEEIVGRLGDELTRGAKAYETIDENTVQIAAGMRLDEAQEVLGLALPEGPYETVAGFILERLGHIPKEGERLAFDNVVMVVTAMEGLRIHRVLIVKGQAASEIAPQGSPGESS